jgi:glycosyltransferase involved in cell wall biosynthesis
VYYLSDSPSKFSCTTEKQAATIVPSERLGVLWSCAFPTIRSLGRLRDLMRRADLVHFHMPWPICDLAGTVLNRTKPAIATYHADIVRQRKVMWLYQPLQHAFMRRLSRIVATSPQYRSTSLALAKFHEKTVVIPLCLENTSFTVAASSDSENLNSPYVLFIGVLRYYKGLDTLLDAAAHTCSRIVIAGHGPMREHLAQRIRNEDLKNVVLVGHVSESQKRGLIERCNAVVLPSTSRAEAFGMVLLEAMRAGKSTITTDIESGMRYVQGEGVGGALIKPNDPLALAKAIDVMIGNTQVAQEMGHAGRARYEQLFVPSVVGAQYAQLYRDVMAAQG